MAVLSHCQSHARAWPLRFGRPQLASLNFCNGEQGADAMRRRRCQPGIASFGQRPIGRHLPAGRKTPFMRSFPASEAFWLTNNAVERRDITFSDELAACARR